ncbi:MAG TPA: ATP-binding protein, partial [Bacteroidales bacterium]|nr:ATP-binding protein [Bacteroidales bacterium]
QGLRWRWSQAHPVRLNDGSILWHGIISDITERKEAEIQLKEKAGQIEAQNEEYQRLNKELIQINDELKKAKDHAEQSDRLKTAFLQNMSHEIRTPMNAIMGFSELLVNQYNNKAKLEEYSQIINLRCADLLEIINEILDVAKIESGQLPVNIEECELNELFSEIYRSFKGIQKWQAKQHINFNIQVNCGNDDNTIRADKVKLKQILINLIGNAFKYTDKGEVQAGCMLDKNKQILFYVSDTGVGIPPDKQEFIFERFAQLEPTPGRLYGGTGLGLSIVKGLVNLLGGKIWLESTPSEGTTFYFNFPYERVEPSQNQQILKSIEYKFNFSGKTILLVEDDEFTADYLKEALNGTGVKVIHTVYGSDAIQISKSQKLDLILLDIRLPDIDGYSVARIIRKEKPEIKIIVQTAYAATEDKENAMKAGSNDYISKPIKRDSLLTLMDKHLINRSEQIL